MEHMRQYGGGDMSGMYPPSPYGYGGPPMMGMPPMGYSVSKNTLGDFGIVLIYPLPQPYQGGYNPYAQQHAMMAAQMAYQQAMMSMSQHGNGSQLNGNGGQSPDRPSSPTGSGYGFPPPQLPMGGMYGWPGHAHGSMSPIPMPMQMNMNMNMGGWGSPGMGPSQGAGGGGGAGQMGSPWLRPQSYAEGNYAGQRSRSTGEERSRVSSFNKDVSGHGHEAS
jgi:CCR4-NOT transcriptional complex subunit CAF120